MVGGGGGGSWDDEGLSEYVPPPSSRGNRMERMDDISPGVIITFYIPAVTRFLPYPAPVNIVNFSNLKDDLKLF